MCSRIRSLWLSAGCLFALVQPHAVRTRPPARGPRLAAVRRRGCSPWLLGERHPCAQPHAVCTRLPA